jgi:hypothetical protein
VSLGANYYLNSSGNDAVFETTDKSAYVVLDARNNGMVSFGTNSSGVATERMRITSAGLVGIGTASPAHLVDALVSSGSASARFGTTHNSGDNDGTVIISNGGSGDAMLRFDYEGSNTDRARIGVTSSGQQLEFYTAGNNERMRIDSNGLVGIGAASSNQTLHVQGNGARLVNSADTDALHLQYFSGSNDAVYAMYSNTGTAAIQITASNNPHAGFGSTSQIIGSETITSVGINSVYGATLVNKSLYATGSTSVNGMYFLANNNNTAGYISWNGTSTSYNTSSDYRMKQGVEDMTGAIDRVKALAPKRFQFIDATDVTVDGFLAHEAQAVVPEAVRGTKDEVDDDNNPVMQAIDQSKLVPLLTAALKESIAKIETLETQRADLEARLTALENAE